MTGLQSILGNAVLAIWCDVDPSQETRFNAWHIHEHLPERLGIPGFLRARRYEAIGASSPRSARFFTLYETQTIDVIASPAYLERLDNPTPLTRRSVSLMENMRRSALRVTATTGQGMGGYVTAWQFHPPDASDQQLRHWLETEALAQALAPVSVIAAHLCEPDIAATQAKDATAEGKATNAVSEAPPWMLLVEAIQEEGLEAAEREIGHDLARRVGGGAEVATVDRYRLTIGLSPPDGSAFTDS